MIPYFKRFKRSPRVAPLGEASDEQLMARFRSSGCEEAFEELTARHIVPAYRTALSILRNHEAVEDVLQQCFLKMVRSRRSYRPGMRFSAWFYTILRNTCRDELRRPRIMSLSNCEVLAPAEDLGPGARLELEEDAMAACSAFALLPDRDREILALRIHGGLKFAQIAAVCGISAEVAKKRAYRALARLRRQLAARRQQVALS